MALKIQDFSFYLYEKGTVVVDQLGNVNSVRHRQWQL